MKRFLKFSAIGCGGFVGLIVCLAVVGALLESSDTSTSSDPSLETVTTTDETVESDPNRIVKNDRAINIISAERIEELSSSNEFIDPVLGPLVVVKFTSENIGNETGNFTFSQYALKDSKDRTYDEVTSLEYSVWRDDQGYQSRSDDYYPGESRDDIAAFRVAPDAAEFNFEWKGSLLPLSISN